jgi:hypothetical protein
VDRHGVVGGKDSPADRCVDGPVVKIIRPCHPDCSITYPFGRRWQTQ